MFFAYVDESGDSGYVNSPSDAFTLAVILIRDREWLEALDRVVAFRKYLRTQYGFSMRAELKAQYLHRGGGPFKVHHVQPDKRSEMYVWAMLLQRKYRWPTFAVVVNKRLVTSPGTCDPRDRAWTYALQRLERFAEQQDEPVHVVPDAGHGYFIRRKMRAMRRFHAVQSFFKTGYLQKPSKFLVEDPSERHSHESYFIQLADLNAYAATRAIHPTPRFGGTMWNHLGRSRLEAVSKLRGGATPGIVSWP